MHSARGTKDAERAWYKGRRARAVRHNRNLAVHTAEDKQTCGPRRRTVAPKEQRPFSFPVLLSPGIVGAQRSGERRPSERAS